MLRQGILLLAIAAVACNDPTTNATKDAATAAQLAAAKGSGALTGNGAPSGPHFNLNIIGVQHDKTIDTTASGGGVIFVQLFGGDTASSLNGKDISTINRQDKIFLVPAPAGESFQVLDKNATDANGAIFQLPVDVSSTYTVWARALGKPGGNSNLTTCATVAVTDSLGVTTNEVDCSLATLSITRTKNAKFQNVSSDLLAITITVDSTANPTLATCLGVTGTQTVTAGLFNSCLQNFFWNVQNNGLHLLQLRFYPNNG